MRCYDQSGHTDSVAADRSSPTHNAPVYFMDGDSNTLARNKRGKSTYFATEVSRLGQEFQQGKHISAVANSYAVVARLLSMSVMFCLLPSSNIDILVC